MAARVLRAAMGGRLKRQASPHIHLPFRRFAIHIQPEFVSTCIPIGLWKFV